MIGEVEMVGDGGEWMDDGGEAWMDDGSEL